MVECQVFGCLSAAREPGRRRQRRNRLAIQAMLLSLHSRER